MPIIPYIFKDIFFFNFNIINNLKVEHKSNEYKNYMYNGAIEPNETRVSKK